MVKDLLFIDANQYINLYEMVSGKTLLAELLQLRGHLLVPYQVVDEVHRQKVRVTARFLTKRYEKLEPSSTTTPGHALTAGELRVLRMPERLRNIRMKLTRDLLEQVSQSKDEVSKALAGVFSQAVSPNKGELNRARRRKERGSPPGKKSGTLGDELCWEQILSRCKQRPRIWIISKDSDYGTTYEGKMFLNAALYQELGRLYKSEPMIFCFDNLAEGFKHFVETTGAVVKNPPTPEETKQIKKEQESLPPLGWLIDYDDSGHIAMQLQDTARMRDSMLHALTAPFGNLVSADDVILPAAPKADKESV
jgi:hypothetical protein